MTPVWHVGPTRKTTHDAYTPNMSYSPPPGRLSPDIFGRKGTPDKFANDSVGGPGHPDNFPPPPPDTFPRGKYFPREREPTIAFANRPKNIVPNTASNVLKLIGTKNGRWELKSWGNGPLRSDGGAGRGPGPNDAEGAVGGTTHSGRKLGGGYYLSLLLYFWGTNSGIRYASNMSRKARAHNEWDHEERMGAMSENGVYLRGQETMFN